MYKPIWPGTYYFNTFTFTSMGNSGHRGPTPDQTYADAPWPSSSYFSIKNGQQNWTVPANGTYQLTAAGAYGATPGRVVTGQVTLSEGQVLTMLVGQQPTPLTANVADNVTVGGGGGTFVVTNGVPLIVASGGDGSGPTSSPGSFTHLPLPYAVTGFTASNPTETTVDLAWNAPLYASSYSIVSSPPTSTLTTSGTSLTFTGLTPYTTYTFTITPSNEFGNGPPTTSNPISTLLPPPDAVTGFTASNPTETTVDLNWNAPLYASSYSIVSSPPTSTLTTSGTSLTFTDLTPDTTYTFTITPSNASGNGPPTTSDPISTLLPYPGYAPAIYNIPVASYLDAITFSWTYYIPPYTDYFNVYCYDAFNYTLLYTQQMFVLIPPYTFTGLQTNYYYRFQLSSVNARGEQPYPSSLSPPMFTLPTVTGVSASNPTTTTVDITWDIPGGNVPDYEFNWLITSTPETTTQQAFGTNFYTFTDLTPGTTYTFTITPQVGLYNLQGSPVTTDPITTL